MKIYEFGKSNFPVHALVWASSEANARFLYSQKVDNLNNSFSIPSPVDFDDFYAILCDFYYDKDKSEGEISINSFSIIKETIKSKESKVILTWGN